MRRLKMLLSLMLLLTTIITGQAQDDSGYTSTVNWFYSACEDRMVIDLHGRMQLGYDLYFQAFDQFGGLGDPITALRRISVNGDYAVSQVIHWLNGETRALGTPISVVIRIGRENDPDNTLFQQPSDDYLGDCEEPGETLVEGIALSADAELVSSAGVFTPDGSLLNPVYRLPSEHMVHIGARSRIVNTPGRTANPGLIFAECNDVDGAAPGVLYDTDELKVFWSWYAKTPEQVQAHINNAQYDVRVDTQPIPNVQVGEIKQLAGDANWWVFYTVSLGDMWRPGGYIIGFAVTWLNAITDGYEDFGPGTQNVRLQSGCHFAIQKNPYGLEIMPTRPEYPLESFPFTGIAD